MSRNTLQILLIEDSEPDIIFFKELANSSETFAVEIRLATDLERGLNFINDTDFDVIVTDLSLPDASGVSAVEKLLAIPVAAPIVVLSGAEDTSLALRAIKCGAQDYLSKNQINTQIVERTLNYSIERYKLKTQLHEVHLQAERYRELSALEKLGEDASAVTSATLGISSLREASAEIFRSLCRQYQQALDLALENLVFHVDKNPAPLLAEIAEVLGGYYAGPRDIIDIHREVINNLEKESPAKRMQAYHIEGRVTALELMGYLTNYYRVRSIS